MRWIWRFWLQNRFRGRLRNESGVVSSAQERGNVILFIDELHALISAGSSSGSLDATNILGPRCVLSTLKVIRRDDTKRISQYIEKDAALARRFQRMTIHEAGIKAQTLQKFSACANDMKFHHIEISDEL